MFSQSGFCDQVRDFSNVSTSFKSWNHVWHFYFPSGFHSSFSRRYYCQTLLCKRFDTKTSISCYALSGIEVSRQNSCARALRFCLYFVFQSFIAPLLMRFMCENLEKGFKPRKMQISKPGFKTSFYYFWPFHMRKVLLLVVKTAMCKRLFCPV